MVKVVVIGATGKSGSRIQTELLSRGHTVTSIARDTSKVTPAPAGTPVTNLKIVQGNVVSDDLAALIAGHDVVVNAYAPPFESTQDLVGFTQRLAAAAKTTNTRLLMVGGAGGLQVAPGQLVIDQSWFPDAWRPIAQAHIDALEVLRTDSSISSNNGGNKLNWTTLSPPGMFQPGERTGKFRTDLENLVADAVSGVSAISMEDYAIALVDEIETPKHIKQRFAVGY